MKTDLKNLIRISRYFGQNPDYVIAGGGNTSYKDDEKLWVKASGVSMADIDEAGFVCLDRGKLKLISTKTYSHLSSEREQEVKKDLYNAIISPKNKRPSVETSMHEIIQYPYVVHTHPTLVNGMLCSKNSQLVVSELFGDSALYIPYTDPGYTLFKAVETGLQKYKEEKGADPQIIFLENHGVFVGGETTEQIQTVYSDIEKKLSKVLPSLPDSTNQKDSPDFSSENNAIKSTRNSIFIIPGSNELIRFFVQDEEKFNLVAKPFTPDNIVYCKSHYLFLKKGDDLILQFLAFKYKYGYYPKIISIQEKGLLALEDSEKSAFIVLNVFLDMMKVSYLTQSFDGPRPMNQKQIDFIDNWEVENYRRKISKGG